VCAWRCAVNVKVVSEMQWARSVSRSFLSGSQFFFLVFNSSPSLQWMPVLLQTFGSLNSNAVVIGKQYVEHGCKERRMYG